MKRKTTPLVLPALILSAINAVSAQENPSIAGAAPADAQVSSWEEKAAPVVAPSTGAVIATTELQTGEKIEITELKRTSGDTVTLKFNVINTGSEEMSLGNFGDGDWYNWNLSKVHLLDLPNKKKYFVLRDTEKQALTSKGKTKLKPGGRLSLWAKFPAPPPTVKRITVEIPEASPIEDLEIAG